jgi:hypothetical protein
MNERYLSHSNWRIFRHSLQNSKIEFSETLKTVLRSRIIFYAVPVPDPVLDEIFDAVPDPV